ncbi:MAG: hypothetical protein JNJ49_10405 [Bdellovibrionaceae bacterium]|nr:hypothetical protein [Pseudobdellovibrionaceae bacterium]
MSILRLRYWIIFFAIIVAAGVYALSEKQPTRSTTMANSLPIEQFDVTKWRENIRAERQAISNDFSSHFARASNSQNTPEVTNPRDDDVALAQLAEFSQARLRRLSDRFKDEYSHRSGKLTADDRTLAKQLDHQIRILKLLETIHRARATLLDSQQRTLDVMAENKDPASLNSNEIFWGKQRPWIEAELVSLQYFSDGTSPNMQKAFIDSVQLDLQRLTQVALELEIRRIDAWKLWRQLHPADEHVAIEYALFIEEQRETLQSFSQMRLQNSQRQAIESGLRKVASLDHDKRR